jgi:hypothetical protein
VTKLDEARAHYHGSNPDAVYITGMSPADQAEVWSEINRLRTLLDPEACDDFARLHAEIERLRAVEKAARILLRGTDVAHPDGQAAVDGLLALREAIESLDRDKAS